MSDVAHIAMQLEIGAARSAAWISAVPWIFESCDTGAMARSQKPRPTRVIRPASR